MKEFEGIRRAAKNTFKTRSMYAILQTLTLICLSSVRVQCLSPEEFKLLYQSTDGSQIERRPNTKDKKIYGYVAPTERPNDRFPQTSNIAPGRDSFVPPYGNRPYTQPDIATVTIQSFDRPDAYVYNSQVTKVAPNLYQPNFQQYRPTQTTHSYPLRNHIKSYRPPQAEAPRPYGYNHGGTRLEHIQNLVHLRNVHSLTQSIEERRKIPYGFTRNGKKYWSSFTTENTPDNASRRTWTAHSIVTDPDGQESLVLERGLRYKGPNPSLYAKSRYNAIEIATDSPDKLQDRTFFWDTRKEENFITKKPINTLLKPHEIEQSVNKSSRDGEGTGLEPHGSRTLLRPLSHPITFRTKVSASVGVEPDASHSSLVAPQGPNFNINHLLSQGFVFAPQSTPSENFRPLNFPLLHSGVSSSLALPVSTTAQNELDAVLPLPDDSPLWVGSTVPTQESSYAFVDSSQGTLFGNAPLYATPSSFPSSYGGTNSGAENSSGTKVPGASGQPGAGTYNSYNGQDRVSMILRLVQELMKNFSGWTVLTLEKLFRLLKKNAQPGEGRSCTDRRGMGGVCTTSRQCRDRGGTPTDEDCTATTMCCIVFVQGCNMNTRQNNTVWVSPAEASAPEAEVFPGNSASTTCVLKVNKLKQNICQIRLDFIKFEIAPPEDGACGRDRLAVYGQNINSGIPHLCGLNTGQHIYIDVDTVPGPLELYVLTGGDFVRQWQIQVAQIECDNPSRPPANCLQYHTEPTNNITSFNYRTDGETTYTNFQNYAVCIRKERGFCSLQYMNSPASGVRAAFDIVNRVILADGTKVPTVEEGEADGTEVPTVEEGEAGVGLQQCPQDYLELGGTRLCGTVLNDGSTDPKFTNNSPVTDRTNGPFIVKFVSNGQHVGRGFNVLYQQIPC
ncbi:CUB domain [Trinorchestia longiramus]|nr:CUB domain [Trinorchestia longiramus]